MTGPVPVVCFTAGGVRFALAAADVLGLADEDRSAPSLASGLGLPPTLGAHRRVVALATPGGAVAVAVDGPVVVGEVAVEQVVAAPPGVPIDPAVLGFARIGGELVQLLATDRVIAALDASRGAP